MIPVVLFSTADAENKSKGVIKMMSDDDRAKVVKCLVNFIDKVTKKERPSKAEVEVLPEVVRALREFNTL